MGSHTLSLNNPKYSGIYILELWQNKHTSEVAALPIVLVVESRNATRIAQSIMVGSFPEKEIKHTLSLN